MKRVLVFNFLGGVIERGIPLYAQDITLCLQRVGVQPVELRCPSWLRRAPRPLRNLAFVLWEQVVAPVKRALHGCTLTIYPYNSAGIIDAMLGRSLVIVHDMIGNSRANGSLTGRYIQFTQAVHRSFRRPVCAASAHTMRQLRRLPAFAPCKLRLWTNPFYTFEKALGLGNTSELPNRSQRLRVLLCSGMGPTKDYRGALRLFVSSHVLRDAELRIVGFGDDAYLARRRVDRLSEDLRARITVLPRLTLDQLIAEYRGSDLVWVHSRKEGFGRFIVEGMLSGRPVLASDIVAFRSFAALGACLYRKNTFDESVQRALDHESALKLTTRTYHEPLEAAVREVVGRYFPAH